MSNIDFTSFIPEPDLAESLGPRFDFDAPVPVGPSPAGGGVFDNFDFGAPIVVTPQPGAATPRPTINGVPVEGPVLPDGGFNLGDAFVPAPSVDDGSDALAALMALANGPQAVPTGGGGGGGGGGASSIIAQIQNMGQGQLAAVEEMLAAQLASAGEFEDIALRDARRSRRVGRRSIRRERERLLEMLGLGQERIAEEGAATAAELAARFDAQRVELDDFGSALQGLLGGANGGPALAEAAAQAVRDSEAFESIDSQLNRRLGQAASDDFDRRGLDARRQANDALQQLANQFAAAQTGIRSTAAEQRATAEQNAIAERNRIQQETQEAIIAAQQRAASARRSGGGSRQPELSFTDQIQQDIARLVATTEIAGQFGIDPGLVGGIPNAAPPAAPTVSQTFLDDIGGTSGASGAIADALANDNVEAARFIASLN